MLLQRLINRSRLAAGLLSLFVVASCASSGPTRDAGPIAAGGAGAPGGSAATSPAIPAAAQTLFEYKEPERVAYLLGNETEGISPQVQALCTHKVKIPMAKGVESLNVAVTASLIAFRNVL